MSDLWMLSWGTGLRDGLSPCMFITCAIFILSMFWFVKNSFKFGPAAIVFVISYALGIMFFNFGPAQLVLYNKYFILVAKLIYFILGLVALVLGVLFLKDWTVIRRGLPFKDVFAGVEGKECSGVDWRLFLLVIIIALFLSALATLWPMNVYMMLLGNEAFIKGQWQTVMPLVGGYVFSSMWPLWIVWAFLSVKNLGPSLLRIVSAAFFLVASSSMILIFK